MKFLVVEENKKINNSISKTLKEYNGGSQVDFAFDGEHGLEMALANKYDLILLSLMLPKVSGRNLLVQLRQKSNAPVIILSEHNDVFAKIDLLEKGADDFVLKTIESMELFAIISAILRRYNNNFTVNKYKLKNLEVDFFEKSVKIDGERVDIVAKMFDLFEYLIRNKGVIISKESLFNRIWGFECETTNAVVEVYISKLRKILAGGDLKQHLLTIKNAGYMWIEKD